MPRNAGVEAPTAFRQQLLDAIPRLRRYARTLVFEPSAADDLVQTTLERALSHWHQYDLRRDIAVWLIGIAHNAFIDEHRRSSRMRIVDPPADGESDATDHLAHPPADLALRVDLTRALQRLAVDHRQVLMLVGVEQFTYAECAEALQVPIGTVMSRVARARIALRELLDGQAHASARGLRRVV